jgi:hypothetical protein
MAIGGDVAIVTKGGPGRSEFLHPPLVRSASTTSVWARLEPWGSGGPYADWQTETIYSTSSRNAQVLMIEESECRRSRTWIGGHICTSESTTATVFWNLRSIWEVDAPPPFQRCWLDRMVMYPSGVYKHSCFAVCQCSSNACRFQTLKILLSLNFTLLHAYENMFIVLHVVLMELTWSPTDLYFSCKIPFFS